MTGHTADTDPGKLLESAMASHGDSPDALIEILHAAQQIYGSLSAPLLKTIATRLKLPPSRVLGVASFYHLFRFAPRFKHCAVICAGTACYVAGSQSLLAQATQLSAAQPGNWTVSTGRCVGSCGLAPVVIIDDLPRARMTSARFADYFGAGS